MEKKPLVLLGTALGFVGLLLCWFLPSMLQGAQRRVEYQALRHVEQARRALSQYNAALGYKSSVLGEMNDVFASLAHFGVVGEFNVNDPSKVSEDSKNEYQEQHKEAWELFKPMDWKSAKSGDWSGVTAKDLKAARPSPAHASYSDITSQMSKGVADRNELIKRNAGLLDDALKLVDQALAVSSGDVNAKSNVEANELKGIILYHKGMAKAAEAVARRREAIPLRAELLSLNAETMGVQPLLNLSAGSAVDKQIRQLDDKKKEDEGKLQQLQADAEKVEASINQLQAKLTQAQRQAETARAELDKTKAAGIDFKNPHGADVFAEKLLAQDKAYRSALREVQTIQRGSLPKAQIDASGDFISGQYVEGAAGSRLTTESGLDHFVGERELLTREIAGRKSMLNNLGTAIAGLNDAKSGMMNRQNEVNEEINGANGYSNQAGKIDSELVQLDQKAFELEEQALKLLQQSAEASKMAASAADRAVGEARELVSKLPPAKQDRSAASIRKDDNWLGGYIGAAEADARLARAGVFQQRYTSYKENTRTYTGLRQYLQLKSADPTTEAFKAHAVKAEEAKTAGVAEINQLMTTLGDVHRKVGQHWTITALAGGAHSMMVLFDQPEYNAEAIEDYRNALKGREDKEYAHWIVERLASLESSKAGS